jgi:hypothetical protein
MAGAERIAAARARSAGARRFERSRTMHMDKNLKTNAGVALVAAMLVFPALVACGSDAESAEPEAASVEQKLTTQFGDVTVTSERESDQSIASTVVDRAGMELQHFSWKPQESLSLKAANESAYTMWRDQQPNKPYMSDACRDNGWGGYCCEVPCGCVVCCGGGACAVVSDTCCGK